MLRIFLGCGLAIMTVFLSAYGACGLETELVMCADLENGACVSGGESACVVAYHGSPRPELECDQDLFCCKVPPVEPPPCEGYNYLCVEQEEGSEPECPNFYYPSEAVGCPAGTHCCSCHNGTPHGSWTCWWR